MMATRDIYIYICFVVNRDNNQIFSRFEHAASDQTRRHLRLSHLRQIVTLCCYVMQSNTVLNPKSYILCLFEI